MKLRILKRYGDKHVNGNGDWLFVHTHGDFEYRNPDRYVSKAEQPEWTLYVAVPVAGREETGGG